jgi:hypothetical protein
MLWYGWLNRRRLEERGNRDRAEKQQRQRELRLREDAIERDRIAVSIARQRADVMRIEQQRAIEAERMANETREADERKRQSAEDERIKRERDDERQRVAYAAQVAEQQQQQAIAAIEAAARKAEAEHAARDLLLQQQQQQAAATAATTAATLTTEASSPTETKTIAGKENVPSGSGMGAAALGLPITTTTSLTNDSSSAADNNGLPGGVSPLVVGPTLSVDTIPSTRPSSLSTMGLMLSPSHSPVADLATLSMGTQFWKVPKVGPAKKKTFRVQKHPSGDYLVKWESKKKSEDQAVFMLSRGIR